MVVDRHGRASRADNDRRHRPVDGFRLRDARRFAHVVEDAIASLPERFHVHIADALVQVVDVPPDPSPADPPDWLEPGGGVPLSRFTPGAGGRPGRLEVYRRPLESRALSRGELAELVRSAVGQEIARAVGFDDDLDDLFDDE